MKKILKAVIFVSLGLFILNLTAIVKISTSDWQTLSFKYTLDIINKSKEETSTPVVILGDSVGAQLFPPYQVPGSFASNGSVLAIGHYIFAYNALHNHKNVKHIILATLPNVIGNEFERKNTYDCFIKPFYTFDNLQFFSHSVFTEMNKKPLSYLAISPFVKTAPVSDINFVELKHKQKSPDLLSDISIEYLKKLNDLAINNNVTLHLISPPVPIRWKQQTNDWENMKKQIKQNHLERLFAGYFESIIYLDEGCFKDGLHLKDDYLEKNRLQIIRTILPRTIVNQYCVSGQPEGWLL